MNDGSDTSETPQFAAWQLQMEGILGQLGPLTDAQLRLHVEIARKWTTLEVLQDLQCGQMLEFSQSVGDLMPLYAGERCLAWGETVIANEYFGIQIQRMASSEEDHPSSSYQDQTFASSVDAVGTPVLVRLLLGVCHVKLEEILQYAPGSVVELDQAVASSHLLMADTQAIGRAEVLILNDLFCARVTEVFKFPVEVDYA